MLIKLSYFDRYICLFIIFPISFQSVIQMPGFRSLGDEELVEFECKESDKGLEATRVSGPSSVDCQGSHRRPLSKKRFRKIRYNIKLHN